MRGMKRLALLGVPGAQGGALAAPSFTVTTTAPAQTLTLTSLGVAADETVTVEWGDGASDDYTGTAQRTHQYASAGEYIVTLRNAAAITGLDIRDAKVSLTLGPAWRAMMPSTLRLDALKATGDVADLPRVTSNLYLYLDGTQSALTGDVADLPRVTSGLYLRLNGTQSALTGDVADLPRVTITLDLRLSNTQSALTGDVADLPRVTSNLYLYLNNTQSALTGDVADLPRVTSNLYLYLNNTQSVIGGGATPVAIDRFNQLQLHDMGLGQAYVNDIIYRLYTDRASITAGTRNVTLGGTNDAPSATPHVDTYIPALIDAGFTISYKTP